jgi:hypothetical protein
MARKRQITGSELRQFRHAVSVLKKQGLIPGKTVNARSVRPFQKRGGKSLESYVRKFRDVVSGRAQVVELPRGAVIEQHKMGRKSVGRGKVLIPKDPSERLVVSKSGAVSHVEKKTGIRSTELPFRITDKAAIERARQVAKEQPGKKWWGYEVKGSKGGSVYEWDSLDLMLRDLKTKYKRKVWKYISILSGVNKNSLRSQEGKPYRAR